MTQPNFIILGAQKAGSSWLAYNIGQHPEIYVYPREIHYFSMKSKHAKGVAWYEEHFAGATEQQRAIGEKTPNYLWITNSEVRSPFGTHLPNVHKSISDYAPDAKLIVVLRDPVHRAISAINHYMRAGQLSPFRHIDDYLVGNSTTEAKNFGVFEMGDYYHALKAYFSVFDRSQFLILFFGSDIVENPELGLHKTCQFLDVDSDHVFTTARDTTNEFFDRSIGVSYAIHTVPKIRPHLRLLERALPNSISSRYLGPPVKKQKPSDAAVEELARYYRDNNKQLFELIECSPEHWLN